MDIEFLAIRCFYSKLCNVNVSRVCMPIMPVPDNYHCLDDYGEEWWKTPFRRERTLLWACIHSHHQESAPVLKQENSGRSRHSIYKVRKSNKTPLTYSIVFRSFYPALGFVSTSPGVSTWIPVLIDSRRSASRCRTSGNIN